MFAWSIFVCFVGEIQLDFLLKSKWSLEMCWSSAAAAARRGVRLLCWESSAFESSNSENQARQRQMQLHIEEAELRRRHESWNRMNVTGEALICFQSEMLALAKWRWSMYLSAAPGSDAIFLRVFRVPVIVLMRTDPKTWFQTVRNPAVEKGNLSSLVIISRGSRLVTKCHKSPQRHSTVCKKNPSNLKRRCFAPREATPKMRCLQPFRVFKIPWLTSDLLKTSKGHVVFASLKRWPRNSSWLNKQFPTVSKLQRWWLQKNVLDISMTPKQV